MPVTMSSAGLSVGGGDSRWEKGRILKGSVQIKWNKFGKNETMRSKRTKMMVDVDVLEAEGIGGQESRRLSFRHENIG